MKKVKSIRNKGIYQKGIKKTIMTIVVIIGILLALIAAIGFILHIEAVDLFFKTHQWAYAILAICFLALSCALILQQEREKKAASMAGTLKLRSSGLDSLFRMVRRGKTILFSTVDNIYPTIEIGDSGIAIEGPSGQPIFRIFEDAHLTISKNRGQIKISAMLIMRDGLAANIEDNEWIVNPSRTFDRNYNKNALEVKDNEGAVVLQVVLLDDRIQFQGKF